MNTATGRPSTIRLKCHGRYEEARAAVLVKPGHLIELTLANEVKPHVTAGGFAERAVATEGLLSLRGLGLDSDYAIGDLVSYHLCHPGDEVQMLLADGEVVTPADFLVSVGDGTLKKAALTEKQMVAKPRESMDLSGVGNTTPQLIKVRIC